MPVVTLRPSLPDYNSPIQVVGATDAITATSDDSDSSYVETVYDLGGHLILAIQDYTIPAGAFIRAARLRYRYRTYGPTADNAQNGTGWISSLLGPDNSNTNTPYEPHSASQRTIVTESGPWNILGPGGVPWNQELVNSIKVWIFAAYYQTIYPNLDMQRFYEIYVDLDVNYNPTTTVTSPPTTETLTTRPGVVFTWADTDGDRMEGYKIKIFSSSQYSAVGFSQWTSTPVWDSGRIYNGTIPSVVYPEVNLEQGTTYRAYVWVYQSGAPIVEPGNGMSNGTAYKQFTINVVQPNQPNVTVTPSSYGVLLEVTPQDNLLEYEGSSAEGATSNYIATNCSVTRSTTFSVAGSYSFSLQATATGTIAMELRNTTTFEGRIPVSPGEQITGLASFRPETAGKPSKVRIKWWKTDGTASTTPHTDGTSTSTVLGAFAQRTVTANVPSDAWWATIEAIVEGVDATHRHFIDNLSLHVGTGTTWSPGVGSQDIDSFEIQRSIDSGTTWSDIRLDWATFGAATLQIIDLEAAPNTPIIYRARLTSNRGGTNNISGPWTITTAVTLTISTWQLRPLRSTDNVITDLAVIGDSFTQRKPEDKATFSPLGRTRKVTVSDVIKGEEGTLQVDFVSETEYQKFEALRNLQETLLLVRGWTNEQWYIQLGEVRTMELFNYFPTYRQVSIDWVEVDVPPI